MSFTRVELREKQRQELETLASRVERDLAAVSITEPNASQTITTGQSLITQLRNSVPTGRLAIRLDQIVRGVADSDIVVKGGDQLIVPDQRQEVTVVGEVQYETSHVFERGADARRVHREERWDDAESRHQAHLRREGERRGRCAIRRAVVRTRF